MIKHRRHHRGVVFEGLSERDRERLDRFLAEIEPTPGLEGLVPTDTPAPPAPERKKGRRI